MGIKQKILNYIKLEQQKINLHEKETEFAILRMSGEKIAKVF